MNDQKRILVQNESKVLEGHKKINTLILAGILLLSFIGLGHSVGGLKELRKRMDNPFTKWVNLPISTSDYKASEDLQKFFMPKNLHDENFPHSCFLLFSQIKNRLRLENWVIN